MAANLEVLHLTPAHTAALTQLFLRIVADDSGRHFHPHPFTPEVAQRISSLAGRDRYFGLARGSELLGYGMLRGWDEGYDVPRLGIYVLPELRGTGAARLLMEHMHTEAARQGARQVQLTVYPDNLPAVGLYRSLGYVFGSAPISDGRIVGNIRLAKWRSKSESTR